MSELLYLGCTPCNEPCEQVGPNYRENVAKAECRAFIRQLKRQFGTPPYGTQLYIRKQPHDFGSYLEVVVRFVDEEGADYAYNIEADLPTVWDDLAIEELRDIYALAESIAADNAEKSP